MTKINYIFLSILLTLFCGVGKVKASAIKSVETPYTLGYIREAKIGGEKCVVASGYDGEVLLISLDGTIKWIRELSGYMNHDICCYDLDGDGSDEILCASADGTLYALDDNGDDLWSFRANEIPLYSVCALECDGEAVVAVGGFDKNIYFLTASNSLLHTIESEEYAITNAWGTAGYDKQGSINYLRRIQNSEGKDLLAVHGMVSSHNGSGGFYVMDVDPKNKQYQVLKSVPEDGGEAIATNSIGYCSINRAADGADKVLLGISVGGNGAGFTEIDQTTGITKKFAFSNYTAFQLNSQFDNFGYRTCQAAAVKGLQEGYDYNYIAYSGTTVIVLRPDLTFDKNKDIKNGKYSFNDMYVDQDSMVMVLSSCQSGGNSIHFVDLTQDGWINDLDAFTPPGNITKILENSNALKSGIASFIQPSWENGRPYIYLMSETATCDAVNSRIGRYPNVNFLSSIFETKIQSAESWNRDEMESDTYRNARHTNRQYVLDADKAVAAVVDNYPGFPGFKETAGVTYPKNTGASYWGGHGSDPFFYSPETWKRALTQVKDCKSAIVFTEIRSDVNADIPFLFNYLWFPIADMIKNGVDARMIIHQHGIFWMTYAYAKEWSPIISGEYAHAFVPGMEETTARNQDVSVAARLGIWASGCVNSWASGCARDNASYDRGRENSHQMLPNHFLRHMIYHTSMGAQYLNSFIVDQDYMALLWDMVGKGLIFVPERDEIISFSPVHLAMETPDEELLEKAEDHKWTIMLDAETVGKREPFVVDKLSSAWVGAPVNEWDYTNYAAKVADRRQNFLPPFPGGVVLFTPAEESNEFRADISQQLHPIYRDIMKVYHTDGRDYIINGERKAADEYYKVIEADIKESAKKLPVTVSDGEVAWVAAHSGPRHIRLTIIDGSYINQDDAYATVTFNTVNPISITDLVTGEKVMTNGEKQFEISVPMGMARFLDVELEEDLI